MRYEGEYLTRPPQFDDAELTTKIKDGVPAARFHHKYKVQMFGTDMSEVIPDNANHSALEGSNPVLVHSYQEGEVIDSTPMMTNDEKPITATSIHVHEAEADYTADGVPAKLVITPRDPGR